VTCETDQLDSEGNEICATAITLLDEATGYLLIPLDLDTESKGYSVRNRVSLLKIIDMWRSELMECDDLESMRFRGIARWFVDEDVTDQYLSTLLSRVDNLIYDGIRSKRRNP
jgi:hypothetical protein